MSHPSIVVRYKSNMPADDWYIRWGEKGAARMTTMIECTVGHYEAHEEHYGKDYVWCSERVVVECDCGERLVLTTSEAVCRCGADHSSLVMAQLASRRTEYRRPHPLEAEYQEWRMKQEEYLLSEETYRLELSALD